MYLIYTHTGIYKITFYILVINTYLITVMLVEVIDLLNSNPFDFPQATHKNDSAAQPPALCDFHHSFCTQKQMCECIQI